MFKVRLNLRKVVAIAICLAGFSTFAYGQTGARVYENKGNFSFQPPSDWSFTEFPGLKYKVAFGPTEKGFATNINFVDETFDGKLTSYVDESLAALKSIFPKFKLLRRETFSTNSGIVGEKIVANNNQQGFNLTQVFYFIPAPKNKYFVITCSVISSVATKYQSVFDESIKTFEFIQ